MKIVKIILFFLGILVFTGCDSKEITAINIDTSKVDLQATIENFDLKTVKVIISYSDYTTEKIDLTNDMIEEKDKHLLNESGTHTINVNYQGFLSSFSITLNDLFYTVSYTNENNEVIHEEKVKKGSNASVFVPEERQGYIFISWDRELKNITEDIIVNPIYEKKKYIVRFLDYDNTVLKEEIIKYQEEIILPTKPQRIGYTFLKWNQEESITADTLIYKAEYLINEYKVTFLDYDNSPISIVMTCYKEKAIEPVMKERTGYTFSGWDKDINSITNDIEVKAVYVINQYEVKFVDFDGTIISMQMITYKEKPITPKDPVRDGYTFVSWDQEINEVTNDIIIKAIYEKNHYTVKFTDYEGNIIKEEIVAFGQSATPPSSPIKDGYTFITWDQSFKKVVNDMLIKPLFKENIYTVKFVDYDGFVLKEINTCHGGSVEFPRSPTRTGYTFSGWSQKATNITQDLVIEALYVINKFTIKFVDYNDQLIKEVMVNYKEDVVLPTNPVRKGYIFVSWDKEAKEVTSDMTLKAIYKLDEASLRGATIIPTLANSDPMDDEGNKGIYFIKKGVNQDLVSAGGVSKTSSLTYWLRLAIDYNDNGYYEIVDKMTTGNANYSNTYLEAMYKIVIYPSSCSDEKASDVFNAAYIGQKIVFIDVDMENGTISENSKIMFVDETIEATSVDIIGPTSGKVGTQLYLSVELSPSNASSFLNWSSSNESIASVNQDGVVSLKTVGEVIITVVSGQARSDIKITITEKDIKNYKDLSGSIASGYIYTGYENVNDYLFDTLDIIYCAFLLVDDDGTFFTGASKYTNNTYLARMTKYILPKAKENGCYSIFSIGGGGQSSSFSVICASPTLRKTFINNIITVINQYGFDGVDIDWETPAKSEKGNFTLLMKELFAAVKANNPNHLVTAAIAGGMWQPPCYDLENSQYYMDYINMMTYGMVNNGGYYQNALYKSTSYTDSVNKVGRTMSSCSIEESIAIYNSYGIPNKKIIIGLAFYGMSQSRTYNEATNSWSSWSSYKGNLYYDDLKNYDGNGYTEYYDTNAGVCYILSDDKKIFISYDNPRSVTEKCEYVKSMNLGGVMYWQNGHDKTNDLLKAIKDSLNK